jgi:N-acetylmuramic acid 6-phosphate etherase
MTDDESKSRGFDRLATEQSNPEYRQIDRNSVLEITKLMNSADRTVPAAVTQSLPQIATAIEAIVDRLRAGGRLLYVGSGTSGRLGVLDAAECPPTFGTDPELVQGIIAGGPSALVRSVEGAEDDLPAGEKAIVDAQVDEHDVVVGISASGRTPYAIGAVREGRRRGALTVSLSCTSEAELSVEVDHPLEVVVGPEIVAGSTRLKAGTATKLVLNMISTVTMIKLGRTYGNRMIELSAINTKLADRAVRIIVDVTGTDEASAREALAQADRRVKVAIVMINNKLDVTAALALLATHNGQLDAVLRASAS